MAALLLALPFVMPAPAAAQAVDGEVAPYLPLIGSALGNGVKVERQPSPGGGVWEAKIQAAGVTVDAYGYKDQSSGPTGGMYVYIPLGTLRLADIVRSSARWARRRPRRISCSPTARSA